MKTEVVIEGAEELAVATDVEFVESEGRIEMTREVVRC